MSSYSAIQMYLYCRTSNFSMCNVTFIIALNFPLILSHKVSHCYVIEPEKVNHVGTYSSISSVLKEIFSFCKLIFAGVAI